MPTYDPLDLSVFANAPADSAPASKDPLDLSIYANPAVVEDTQNRERETAAQALAIIDDYKSRGEPLTPVEETDLFNTLARGGDWSRPQKADFSKVESGSSSSPVLPKTFLEERNDVLAQNIDELKTFGKGMLGSLESKASGAAALAADYGDVIFPYASDESKQEALNINKSLNTEAAGNMAAYKAGAEDMKKRYPAWMVDTVGDISQNPESAASIVGGPAAVLPGASVFLQEYGQSRAAGLTPEESTANAAIQGGTELAIESIPSSKLLSRLPVVGTAIKKVEKGVAQSLESRFGQALNTAVRATTTSAGEGLEEGVTGIIQDATRRAQASKELLIGSDAARAYAETQVIEEGTYWENILRQARAGALMGGGIGGIQATVQGAQQGQQMRQEREGGLENSINTRLGNELLSQRTDTDLATTKADTTLNQDIGFELQRKQADEAKQQAFEQAEKAAEEQRGLEEEAGFQTLERGSVSPTSRVEKYTGVVERVPVEPAREVTAEDVAGQRAAAERAEAERVQRVAEGKKIEKRRKATEKAKAIEVAATPTASSIEKAKPLPIFKPKGKKAAPANVIPAATKPIASQTESELNDLAEKMGLSLGMAASKADLKAAGQARRGTEEPSEAEVAEEASTPTVEDFAPKAKTFVKALAGRTRQDSRDVQTLIHQGKIVVAPNARTLGREEAGRQAEYDMSDGKMYLYLDNMADPSDAVGHIAAALHETNHALLTPAQIKSAAGMLRNAAGKGNTHAKKALSDAQADTAARDGDTTFEDEELVAYFASHTKAAEGKVLGSVGAIVRDLTSSAKAAIRKHVGLDLDVSIGEVATALNGALGDATRTDIKGRKASGSLAMIAGPTATNFKKKQSNGETYTGARDFGERFEIPDNKAELVDSRGIYDNLSNGNSIDLDELLSHDRMFSEYPQLRALKVQIDKEMPRGINGQYDPDSNQIKVAPQFVAQAQQGNVTEAFRKLILHETQHAIQTIEGFVPGANSANFIPKSVTRTVQDARTKVNQIIKNFDLGRAVQTLPPQTKSTWDNMVRSGLAESREAQAAMFLEEGYQEDSSDRMIQRYGTTYKEAVKAYDLASDAQFDAEQKAFQTYLRDYGETEARNTEYRSRMTPEELAAEAPESTMAKAEGKIPVERTLDTTPYAGNGKAVPESKTLGMAAVKDAPKSEAAFNKWFGDSKIVNADGTPQVMYHGTQSQFNTFKENDLGLIFVSPSERFANSFAKAEVGEDDLGPLLLGYNTKPLYVRAENPWDYKSRDDLNALHAAMMKAPNSVFDEFTQDSYKRSAFLNQVLPDGDWAALENPFVVNWMKDNNYDGMYINEGGAKNLAVFDPNQLKHATDNNGEFSTTNNSILGMAASQTPEAKKVRRSAVVLDFIPLGQKARIIGTGLLSNSKFLGHDLLEAFEFAKSSPAAEEATANASLGKYDNALQKLAIARGTTAEALNDQIMKELDAIDDKSNSYDVNLAAYKAVTSKYGDAGQHLLDLRNQTDALTLEMLRLRAASPNKPSAEESKTMKTMIANMGRYSHRLYAAHQGKAGKKYAHAVMAAWNKGSKLAGTVKEYAELDPEQAAKRLTALTTKQQETFNMAHRAVKSLIDDSLMIPEDKALAELGGDTLTRLYKTWGKEKSTAVSLDEMRDELAAIREKINANGPRLEATAEDILKQILGLKDSKQPIATYYRGGKTDRGILQERTRIPATIRAVMGEITDPGTRLLAAVAKQAEFVARTKFLLEVQQKARAEDLQPPDSTGTPTVLANGMTKLEGEGFGPLDGWYASPNLHALLDDVRESIANFEQVAGMAGQDPGKVGEKLITTALEKWAVVAGLSKRAQIVGNLFLQPLNFLGAVMAPLMNGNINPATYGRGLLDAVALIRYSNNPSLGLGGASDAVRYGVTDSATVGELKGMPYEKIQQLAVLMTGKKPNQLLRFAKKVGLTLQETYAMADVWAKVANYHNEVNTLTRFYKRNNQTRTEEQIKREAADVVNRTNITYKRALPLMKALERGGVTAFGTYFYEVFRSQIGNALQGIKEATYDVAQATTPAAKADRLQRGLTRLGGQAAYWAAAQQFSSMLGSMMFGDDEDEWDKRSMFPEYAQNQDLYPVGLDKDGKPVYFSVSRVDAIGPITDIMRQAMTGGLNYEKAKEQLVDLYIKPRIVPQIVMAIKTITDESRPTRDPLVQEWAPSGYQYLLKAGGAVGVEDKTTRALTNLAESIVMPGTLNATRKSNPTIESPMSVADDATALEKAGNNLATQTFVAAKVFGATFIKADPAKSMSFAKMDYEDFQKNARKDMVEQFHNRPDITQEEIQENIKDAVTQEQKLWNEVARVYRGMKANDMSTADINAAMKSAKVEGSLATQVKNQKFKSGIVSEQSFKKLAQNQMRDMNPEEKKQAKKEWDAAWNRLQQIQQESE